MNYGPKNKIFVRLESMRTKILAIFAALVAISGHTNPFTTPESLKPQVEFWTKIYSYYDSNQVVFYDQVDPRVIYAVLDLPRIPQELSAPKFKDQVQKRFKELESTLEKISQNLKPEPLPNDWKGIYDKLSNFNLLKTPDLAKRLRSQSGLKSQFAIGLSASGRYTDDMKAILKAHELPNELIALVFVESLFFLSATSHAGASGPWGIMKETALRTGIHINNFTDERLDPVVATWAAAQYLKKAKEGLGEWPLAITSYNYGYPGMLRAVNNLNTKNIEEIIAKHESPIFGYASKNYYAEFLAALDVYNKSGQLFPEVKVDQPWRYELVQVMRPVEVADLFGTKALQKDELVRLNPSLSQRTVNGHEVLPPQYSLRVPVGKSDHFYKKLKLVPNNKRQSAEWKISTKYKTNGKESLSLIAQKHGISLEFLTKKLNESLSYRPKGTVIIRSQAHRFSQLKEIGQQIMAAFSSSKGG